MDARHFVYYATNSQDTVMGVRECKIGEALRRGQLELLSQKVPSQQWGSVNLFDLCLIFGHVDIAMALARNVEGCRVEAHHLKRIWNNHTPLSCHQCESEHVTCDECCFGFSTEEGIWMNDWNASLEDATCAARETAEQHLVHAVLEALSSSATLPFISEEAMAHLLDLAILTGNKEAARRCAELSHVRPLRRWPKKICRLYCRSFRQKDVKVDVPTLYLSVPTPVTQDDDDQVLRLIAALSAGARLHLTFRFVMPLFLGCGFCLTLHEALILSNASWADLKELLLPKIEQMPGNEPNHRGHFFLEPTTGRLHKDLLQKAQMAGMSLQTWQVLAYEENPRQHVSLSLLDVAILLGQDDCAVLCATMGAKVSQDGFKFLQQYLDADPARRPAAIAAANQMLTMSWKSEISAAVAVYQVMMKFAGYPSLFVNQVMAYAMDVPEIVDQLDLWEEARAWCERPLRSLL